MCTLMLCVVCEFKGGGICLGGVLGVCCLGVCAVGFHEWHSCEFDGCHMCWAV